MEAGVGSRPASDAELPQALWPAREEFESVLELCAFERGRGKEVIELVGSLGQEAVEGWMRDCGGLLQSCGRYAYG